MARPNLEKRLFPFHRPRLRNEIFRRRSVKRCNKRRKWSEFEIFLFLFSRRISLREQGVIIFRILEIYGRKEDIFMKSYLILEKDFEQRIPYRIAAISILIQRNSVILNVWRIVYIVSTNVSPDLSLLGRRRLGLERLWGSVGEGKGDVFSGQQQISYD